MNMFISQAMLQRAEAREEEYKAENDKDLVTEDPGFRPEAQDYYMKAGQSKRIWNELYKVWNSPLMCLSDMSLEVSKDIFNNVFI